MTWKQASTSISTSGAHLFQTAYLTTAGDISFISTQGTKVEKYLKNDYSSTLYKLIPNPYLFLTDLSSMWKSSDGKDFSSSVSYSGIPAPHRFYDHSGGTIKNNVLIVQPLDDNTSKSQVFYSTDFGTTFTSALSANGGYDLNNFKQSQNYLWVKKAATPTPKLCRSSDGITWTETGFNSSVYLKSICEFGSYVVMSDGTNQLFISSDNGASFTGYSMYNSDVMTYSYNISYVEKRTVGGQDRIYFGYEVNNMMAYQSQQGSGYITAVPTANDWSWTQVAQNSMDNIYYQTMAFGSNKHVKFTKDGTDYTFLYFNGSAGTVYAAFPSMQMLTGPHTYYQSAWYDKQAQKFYILKNDDITPALKVYEVNLSTYALTDVTSSFTLPLSIFSQPFVISEK